MGGKQRIMTLYSESALDLPFGKNGKFSFQLGYTPVVSDMKKNRSESCRIVFPHMDVNRMGYGYCNIIYGQIRQKSLIFFVYL